MAVYFRYDRRLLGDLCRVAAGVIVESFRVLLAVPQVQPGLVVCVHTYGDGLDGHSVLVAESCLYSELRIHAAKENVDPSVNAVLQFGPYLSWAEET